MFHVKGNWGSNSVYMETGRLAQRSLSSVYLKIGSTAVLSVITVSESTQDSSFLPLAVNYSERCYAFGKIPGGFFKREGRPSEREILISRLIDRSIRPLFLENFSYGVSVNCILLSYGRDFDPDIVAVNSASCALLLSSIPTNQKGCAVTTRVCKVDGEFKINRATSFSKDLSEMSVIFTSLDDSIIMLEGEGRSAQKDDFIEGMKTACATHSVMRDLAQDLHAKSSCSRFNRFFSFSKVDSHLFGSLGTDFRSKIEQNLSIKNLCERAHGLHLIKEELKECLVDSSLLNEEEDLLSSINNYIDTIRANFIRSGIIERSIRIDGRALDEIRDISCLKGLLGDTSHGNALFTRGETQVLAAVTLGVDEDAQNVEVLGSFLKNFFVFHYNFPSFSVGETSRSFGPSRREIGHGFLAKKAIAAILPDGERLLHSIRVVSEVLSSNGSSSMASVCAASLALMDAGVAIKEPCAGIAMGLVFDKVTGSFFTLTDISGDEDGCGDMDFKIAATNSGINALQMDSKIFGITLPVLNNAFEKGLVACAKVLSIMESQCGSEISPEYKRSVPVIQNFVISQSKVPLLIGTKGRTIKGLVEKYDVKINVEDGGSVSISSSDQDVLRAVRQHIDSIVSVSKPVVGQLYKAVVVRVEPYGVFVRYCGNRKALLRISDSITSKKMVVGSSCTVRFNGVGTKGRDRITISNSDDSISE